MFSAARLPICTAARQGPLCENNGGEGGAWLRVTQRQRAGEEFPQAYSYGHYCHYSRDH